ncbi:MAG: class I SAM-dependent RNA methyltransferase [Chloroflexi bacterium]|nr:class I SAM-dependent RNA methyltransferase [Chloroflexota bacterium]
MPDDTFELELTDMAHGGSAIGRHGGRLVFLPYAIPGERARVRVTHEKGRVAFAEGLMLLEASADRVQPRCPHFGPGKCGRCHWQHIAYPAQLLLKQDVLADQLDRLGGFGAADVRAVIASPQEWVYNHHMTFALVKAKQLPVVSHRSEEVTSHQLPVTSSENSALSTQYSALGTRHSPLLAFPSTVEGRFHPIVECHILHPELLALKNALDLDSLPDVDQVRLQIGTDGAHMIILTLTSEDAPELETDLPTSVNILLPDHEPVNLIGDSHSYYAIGGRTFRVTAGSTIRPNVSQLDNLVSIVLNALDLRGGETVLDLYAGVGIFSAFIAPRARRVTLVESYPPAVTDSDENLNDFDNVDIIEGSVEDVLDALEGRYEAALVDPPASGLSTDALDRLADIGAPRLVYVSSDPATLARDGKRLAAKGYRLRYVQPIDLAPQTYYIDSVALFERK